VAIEPPLYDAVQAAVEVALREDRTAHDITTAATVPKSLKGKARFVAREAGIVAGMPVVEEVFLRTHRSVSVRVIAADGEPFQAGQVIAIAEGPVRALLQGERVALNFLQRLCGIATLTRGFVDAVAGTWAEILDTRKTTPGLRALEKYAVRCGGGTNHRFDLASMAMIKDNHREALSRMERSLADGVREIREISPGVAVEVEIDGLDDLEAALEAEPEWILLDNMSVDDMAEAVRLNAGRAKLEASGGVTLANRCQVGSMSMLKSRVGAEWVSAPTEMKSTPASAMARTVSSATPPEASSEGPLSEPPPSLSRSLTAPRSVSVSMLSSRRTSAPVPRA
jgi:nicotinate-nucleotide pyrophosphorylase (carboxylating)